MAKQSIQSAITALGPWFHNIDLGDGVTTKDGTVGSEPVDHPRPTWEFVKRAVPDDLKGRSVLDIGCNAGFYSIEAKRRGAKRVLGIDADSRAVRQACFVRDVLGLDIEYRRMSIYDISPRNVGTFDVTFALGLLYHCKHPIAAVERLLTVTRGLVVIESGVLPESAAESVRHENLGGIWSNLHSLAYVENDSAARESAYNWFLPSVSGLCAILKDVGFQNVRLVEQFHARGLVTAWNESAPDSARHPAFLGARLEFAASLPDSYKTGQTIAIRIRAENTGKSTWLSRGGVSGRGTVHVAAHLINPATYDMKEGAPRVGFPRDIQPGDSGEALLTITLPAERGTYELEIDLVAEQVAWFQDCGATQSLTAVLNVE